MAFLVTYWYILAIVVVALAFYVSKRALKGQIRTHALKYLLAAEKLVFTTTEARLSVVADTAYAALPAPLKLIVTPTAFEMIVTELYNEVKQLVDELHTT